MDSTEYFLWIKGEQLGPYTFEDLREIWNAREGNSDTLFCSPGDTDWKPLSSMAAQLEPKKSLPAAHAYKAEPLLASCPACGNQVSQKALACPKCGHKLRSEQSAIGIVAAIIIGLILGGWVLNAILR